MSAAPAIAFVASQHPHSQQAVQGLRQRYGDCLPDQADVIVALGGDGFMLHTLHEHTHLAQPVFGMRFGEVGFLMNRYEEVGLIERIAAAREVELIPLRMVAERVDGTRHEHTHRI